MPADDTHMGMPSPFDHAEKLVDSTTRWRLESEDLHIRNHDQTAGYDIQLRIEQDGEVYHDTEYYLLPDQAGCTVNLLQPGEYTVIASIDDTVAKTAVVEVSDDPDQTIFLEISNNELHLSEGVK